MLFSLVQYCDLYTAAWLYVDAISTTVFGFFHTAQIVAIQFTFYWTYIQLGLIDLELPSNKIFRNPSIGIVLKSHSHSTKQIILFKLRHRILSCFMILFSHNIAFLKIILHTYLNAIDFVFNAKAIKLDPCRLRAVYWSLLWVANEKRGQNYFQN